MGRKPRLIVWLGALAAMACLAPFAAAQNAKGDKVRINTVDGVTLAGTFYAGKGSTPPTVLMLHAITESSKKEGWVQLAEKLQEKGFAVLTFDFRGHGGSKDIDPQKFYKHAFNKQVRGRESIEFRDFGKGYYPALVNDIAAAKCFLDRKNDARECNTSSLIVIGAETGATLGALWMRSEWHRHRMKAPPFGGKLMPDSRPEGADTICGIWLSMSPTLGQYQPNLTSLLLKPGKEKAVPMLFLYGSEDKTSQKIAKGLEQALVKYKGKDAHGKPMRDEKYRYTAAVPLASRLKGTGLLQKSLETTDRIVEYLDGVVQLKGNEWTDRDFRNTAFVWTFPRFMPARLAGEMNLDFNSYLEFLGR